MGESKTARVWKRTWVGALIAAALALVLWAASRFQSGLPILAAASLVIAAAIWEFDHLGSLRGRRFGLVLATPAALLIGYISLPVSFHPPTSVAIPQEVGLTFVLAASSIALAYWCVPSFGLVRGWSWALRVASLVSLGIVAVDTSSIGGGGASFFVGLVAWLFVLVLLLVRGGRTVRADLAIAVGASAWIVTPLACLALFDFAFGWLGLVALIATSKVGDIAAYYVGSAIGRHHPFPTISPGKTIEGCTASFVAGTLGGVACVALDLMPHSPLGLLGGALGGAIVNIAAQAGDLLESWVKRRVGVKDSGTLFGPSGGVLDLIDSLLLSVPAALVTWPLLFGF